MKIAISVPDKTFKAAEKLAKKMKVSRSRLFGLAVEKLLAQEDHQKRVAELNKIFEKVDTRPDPFMREAARRTIERNRW